MLKLRKASFKMLWRLLNVFHFGLSSQPLLLCAGSTHESQIVQATCAAVSASRSRVREPLCAPCACSWRGAFGRGGESPIVEVTSRDDFSKTRRNWPDVSAFLARPLCLQS